MGTPTVIHLGYIHHQPLLLFSTALEEVAWEFKTTPTVSPLYCYRHHMEGWVVYCETRPSISSLCCFESSADYPCPVNLLCVWPCGILRIYIYNTFPESIFSSIFFLCLVNSWKLVKEKVKPLCQESVFLFLSLENTFLSLQNT